MNSATPMDGCMSRVDDSKSMRQMPMQVFCAPHITGLSRALGTSFQPIRYILKDGKIIVSNVRYSSSLFKEGWLSASGTIEASGTNTLQIHFDRFWVDFGNNLRPELNKGRLPLRRGNCGLSMAHTFV